MKIRKTKGFYETFERSGQDTRATHYCAGCGHGILHKLIAEALVDFGLQDRTIFISPIGCAVFGYYYLDCGNINAAHGRAPAVGTALVRTLKDPVVIVYQGDGDLGAIGFNNCFQAASRGERFVTFFVNNATYGMTGGQMAPTTLVGQKTATSPYGRNPLTDGYPLHACEVLNTLKPPVYIERCSLADTRRIMQARKAVRKALEIQRDGKGYAFVEFLAPCPTNMSMTPGQSSRFVIEQMEAEFPLACFRDQTATAEPRPPRGPHPSVVEYFTRDPGPETAPPDLNAPERRFKAAGFGGQGVLSLALIVAEAGRYAGRQTSWFPNYGPEQRGGAASCSVVISGPPIGSPVVERPDVLVCMNRPAYDRFAAEVKPGGWIVCDSLVPENLPTPAGVHRMTVPSTELATQHGAPKAANTFLLAVLAHSGLLNFPPERIVQALEETFRKRPALAEKNRRIYAMAEAWFREHRPHDLPAAPTAG